MISVIKNKRNTEVFSRQIPDDAIRKAVAVCAASFMVMVVSSLLLCYVSGGTVADVLYETVSATATVGLTRGLTPNLTVGGKLIVIATMYFGRVGPISLAVAFAANKGSRNIVTCPKEDINIG